MISVIVPAKNEASQIALCLKSLLNQEGYIFGKDYEIILVDDGSVDETAAIGEQLGVRVIRQANAGPAAARNAGARSAEGEILLFTDSDCIVSPDWLIEMVKPFRNKEVIGAKGIYHTREKGLTPRFVQMEYESKYKRMAGRERIDFIDTYSAAYRRDVFLTNGGFDETFPAPSVEDQEFSFRLSHKGYRLVFHPSAIVYHRHDGNLREYFSRKFQIGYWKAFLIRWHPEKIISDSHTPASQRIQIALLALMILTVFCIPLWSGAIFASLGLLLLFLISSMPFLSLIIQRDRELFFIAFPLLVIRAFALGLGLSVGIFHRPVEIYSDKNVHKNRIWEQVIKRMMDIVGGGIGVALFSPLIAIFGVLIRIDSEGPVFYSQIRCGKDGKPFRMYKLRTMQKDADKRIKEVLEQNHLTGPVYKIKNDPRVTKIGRFLRRWSLDELPQFWNVFKGEMSLVGPRPEEAWVVEKYNDYQRLRLSVKPGIFGPMQVSGRGDLDLDARLKLELDYIQHYSIWKDITILLKAFPAVLGGKGAY